MERVSKDKYICVESYRNEYEKVNLLYWQVTCECFYTPEEWNSGLNILIIMEIIHLYISNDKQFNSTDAAILFKQKTFYW